MYEQEIFRMITSSTTPGCTPLNELDSNATIWAMASAANGEYFVNGSTQAVRVWQAAVDGKQTATMTTGNVTINCLAVSRDDKRIAAGTFHGEVWMWDAKTYEQVFVQWVGSYGINGVDFSPDSTRLVVASRSCTVNILDASTGWQVLTLGPCPNTDDRVVAAKYSPQGDRIATATPRSVRVYDSNGGHLLDIPLAVAPWYNTGLVWFNNDLFVVSDSKIKQINASTGSPISEWPVPDTNHSSHISLPQHGEFVAYSAKRTVTFWDVPTHTQLGHIQSSRDVRSIALSPDGRFIAIGGEGGKMTIRCLSGITEPDIQIDDAVLHSWKQDQLANADALLTAAIPTSQNTSHHVFASRALVRARLRQWDAAIDDANESIEIRPSIIAYIAKSITLVGKGEKHKGYRACDSAFEHVHPTHVRFLLLIKAIIAFIAGEHGDAMSRIEDLIATVPFNSTCYVVQAYMHLLLGNSHMESNNYQRAVHSFECAAAQMGQHTSQPLLAISLISGWNFDGLCVTIQQRLCEALFAAGRTNDAGESLLKMVTTIGEEVYMTESMTKWVSDFTHWCLSTPESGSDTASKATQVQSLHATLDSSILTPLVREWAKATLVRGSCKDALIAATDFKVPRFTVYREICECLETDDRVVEATECFHEMDAELGRVIRGKEAKWSLDFKCRCCRRLEDLGDAAMNALQYDKAIFHYSAALSFSPTALQAVFVKRSEACAARGLWQDALNDANEAIVLDPSSPSGYERKYVALRGTGQHKDMLDTFEVMFSKMSRSLDLEIYERYRQYTKTKETIRRAIQDAIRESPRVLINTTSGRLCNKSEQATAFERLPIFTELILSMTAHVDHARIEQEVKDYYRYATFSHKWEVNEPLFDEVINIMVYDLEESPTHDKLQMFCKIVRDAGFHWAWSDTCCINKPDHFVLQEALVAMFKWYQGSALTIIFLRGVSSLSRRGALVRSVWNTRAWTFQEYHASQVVRFYTEDWTPYLNLNVPNHKESPEIISEMEEATDVSARVLMGLRPGLNDIREKLRLASQRETTFVEDAAYSLLGIFSVSLPVVYGEGDRSLGRLLAQLLESSGDTSLLAWTGRSGSFNSCLPASITEFNQRPTTHIPSVIRRTEMDIVAAGLRAPSVYFPLAMELYDRLHAFPVPSFSGRRMKLPCITFKLGPLSALRSTDGSEYVFRAQTTALGIVEIRTKENLSRFSSLHLIHPWIDFLLDRQPVRSIMETIQEESMEDCFPSMSELSSSSGPSNIPSGVPQTPVAPFAASHGQSFDGPNQPATSHRYGDGPPLRPPSTALPMDKEIRALRLITRLTLPFGALLLTPDLGNVAAYSRVAADSLITVQVGGITPMMLDKLVDSVRVLDVL